MERAFPFTTSRVSPIASFSISLPPSHFHFTFVDRRKEVKSGKPLDEKRATDKIFRGRNPYPFDFKWCRWGESNPHEVALTAFLIPKPS
jgi:hypothetical protein